MLNNIVMNWNNLTMSQRSDLMKLYLKHGITSLDYMKEHYNNFQDGGETRLKHKPITYNWSNIQTTERRPYDTTYLDRIVEGLTNFGYNQNQIATIIGTIIEESGGNPLAISNTGKYRGLLQWDNSRYKSFDAAAVPDSQWASQMWYLDTTLRNSKGGNDWNRGYNTGWDTYQTPYNMFWDVNSNLEDVAKGFQLGYVRPKGGIDSHNNRFKVIKQVYNILNNNE